MEVKWATYYGTDGFDAGHDLVCIETGNIPAPWSAKGWA